MRLLMILLFCSLGSAAVAQPISIEVLDEATLDMDSVQKKRLDNLKSLPGTVNYKLFVPLDKSLVKPSFNLNVGDLFGGTNNLNLKIQRNDLNSAPANNADVSATLGLDGSVPATAEATFTVRSGQITGTAVEQGYAYIVRPLGGGLHAIVKREISKLPPDHPPADAMPVSPRKPVDEFNAKNDSGSGAVIIPIVVAYHSNVETTTADPEGLIQNAIDATNASLVNSKVNLQVVAKRVLRIDIAGTLDVLKAVSLLQANSDTMAPIVSAMTETKAGIAIVLVNEGWACGKASAILGQPEKAFAAVRQDCAVDKRSFPHELGHLFGARHERASDNATEPFPFGHGYQSKTRRWRDIMANDCGVACERRLIWSSPDIQIDGEPAGSVEHEDNARVLRHTGPFIAAW